MPYADKFKSVIKYASQPTAIAILGSVGVHAALGALLPSLPIFPDPAPIRRNVSVVELSPGQAQRLPNLDPPPPMPFAGLPNSTQLLPGNSGLGSNDFFGPPDEMQSVPLLPSQPDPSLDTTARTSPSVNTPNNVQLRSRNSTASAEQILRQQAALEAYLRAQQNNQRSNNRRIPGGLTSGATMQARGLPGQSDFQVRTDLPPAEILRQSLQPNPDATEGNASDLPLHDGNSPIVLNPRNPQTPETPEAENTENPNPPENTTTANQNRPPQSAQERIRQHQQQIARIQAQQRVQDDSSGGDASNWSQATQQAAIQRRSLAGRYPQAACASKAQGTAIYSVLVDASGSIANLRPLQGTGNAILNQAAQSQVSNANLSAQGGTTPYYVAVNFQYNPEVCTAQSPSPTQTTPSPTTPAAPENTEETPTRPAPENTEETPTRPAPQNNKPTPARPVPENTEETPTRPVPENTEETPTRPAPANTEQPPTRPTPQPNNRPTPTPPEPEAQPSPAPSPAPAATPSEPPTPEAENTEVDAIAVPMDKPKKD